MTKKIKEECYKCGSHNTYVKEGELRCRGCGSIFVNKINNKKVENELE